VAHFKNPLPLVFYGYLITYLGYSFIEEGIKFLLIKKNIRQFPYSFFLGFGFGIGETILRYPFFEFGAVPLRRIWAILLHIITAGIIGYFAKKGKPALGLLIAIVLHTGFNLFIEYTFYK